MSVEVPPVLVGPLRESLLLLYEATAEALHLALRARGEDREALEEVLQHRARLASLDATVDQLGWRADSELAGGGLTAPAELLRDALHGALIEACERLATAANGRTGDLSTECVDAATGEVAALGRLLGCVDHRPSNL
jgi:hypothetical protein